MIDYYKKYLKYKTKYFKLLGGSKGTYDIETNRCNWTIPKSDGPKEYFINFLWLSKDIEESRRQKYIIPFKNEDFLGIKIIKLEYIIHFLNVIKWSQLNPRATIFFWHDSIPEIVDNTRRLIYELLSNEELFTLLTLVEKIIRYSKNLYCDFSFIHEFGFLDDIDKSISEFQLCEIQKNLTDELTDRYLEYTIEKQDDKIIKIHNIKFKEDFKELVKRISELINFDETTGFIRVVLGVPVSIRLEYLHFKSILELERLQQLEYTGKHLIQYFGLNPDNSIIGRYFSTITTKLTNVSHIDRLTIDTHLDYTAGDKIFAVNQENPNNNFKGRVISYNKQTGELIIDIIDIANGFKNINDDKIIYKVSKIYLSVFVRVDLIRLVILIDQITKNPNSYAIYADLDSRGVDENFLFNDESINLLDAHGLVLPLGQSQHYENSFHILAGENLTCDNLMIIAIQKILIDYNIQKIINNYTLDSQDIFVSYQDLFTYYFIMKGIYTRKDIVYNSILIDLLFKSGNIKLLLPKQNSSHPNRQILILDRDTLLALDIQEIGKIFFSKQIRVKNIGFFKETISIDEFKKYIPVRIDLGKLSPHRSVWAGYEKKYLLL